ncbi:tetraacyldisaccharide 4'-kinase [Candidatus Paracaedibacter symbiosus]|uniref:tetraacyldisaccharide 4'-kinase n=1 Tax=Candidatus Paracaedibacter symbiosus TaxID=244582 RepID=UPI0018DC35F0|nr:tetraacyldisaccharide 4'-kinase [Candidatus Paracaedibacter symbiosus]
MATLLAPLSLVVIAMGRRRRHRTKAHHVCVPVICVGNVTVGGSGKTPLVLTLAQGLQQQGFTPHILSRGYGVKLEKPTQVLANHLATEVGDEPLLLAKTAPTWVYPDRCQTANLAVEAGATILLLDDGFQNPTLYQDIKLLVVDGATHFGNGHVLPAGPLREPLEDAVNRADAILLYGEMADLSWTQDKPIFRVKFVSNQKPRAPAYLAFAGIGRPQKFFESLTKNGFYLQETHSFPDHHVYCEKEINQLLNQAHQQQLTLITTTKDAVKIPLSLQPLIEVFNVSCVFEDPQSFQNWLLKKLEKIK